MTELSAPAQRMRFFTAAADLTTAASRAAGADGCNHLGLLSLDDSGQIVGHAACWRVSGHRAEVAVEISDRARHQGLATLLIGEHSSSSSVLSVASAGSMSCSPRSAGSL